MQIDADVEISDEEVTKKRITGKQTSDQYPKTPMYYRMDEDDEFLDEWMHGSDGQESETSIAGDTQTTAASSSARGEDVDLLNDTAHSLRKEISEIKEQIDSFIRDTDKIIVGKLSRGVDVADV